MTASIRTDVVDAHALMAVGALQEKNRVGSHPEPAGDRRALRVTLQALAGTSSACPYALIFPVAAGPAIRARTGQLSRGDLADAGTQAERECQAKSQPVPHQNPPCSIK